MTTNSDSNPPDPRAHLDRRDLPADPGSADPDRTLRLIRTGLALLVVLVVLLCGVVLWRAWLSEMAQASNQVTTTARLLERSASATLDKISTALGNASDQFEAQLSAGGIDPKTVWNIADKAAAQAPEVQRIAIFDREGRQICGQPNDRCLNLSISDRRYFAILKIRPEMPPSLYGPFPSRLDGQPAMVLARALRTPAMPFAGVIIAVVPVANLRSLVQASTLGPHGVASLRTREMELLTRAPALSDGATSTLISDELRNSLSRSPDDATYQSIAPTDGTERVMAYRRLPTYPMYVLVGEATKDFLVGWRQAVYWTTGFLLLFIGAVVAIQHVARNSLRHQAREQRLYNAAPCGYHTLDADGRYRSVNDTELNWLGCAREDVIGKLRPSDFYPAERREAFSRNYSNLKAHGHVEDLEADLIGRHGQIRHVLISAVRVTDRRGNFQHSNSVMYDITALHTARTELEARAAEQQAMLDNDLVGIVRSRDGFIVWKNKGMDRIFGYEEAEWQAMPVVTLYPSAQAYDEIALEMSHHAKNDGIFRRQVQMCRKDGSIVWIDGAGIRLMPDRGEIMSILTDITELKHSEAARVRAAELEAQNLSLRETSRLKDEFVSNLSHELRTPLNAVIGFSALLRSGDVGPGTEKYARYVRHIGESGQHLLELVESMLDFAKNEAGKLILNPEPVNVNDVLNEVVEMLGPKCQRLNVRMTSSVDPTLIDVVTDRLRLRQMVLNLADNAIKFSRPAGEVDVRARALDDTRWCVEVEDHGIGIAEEDIAKLFQPFRQLSTGTTKTHGGTGLGLALVRRIARAQSGDVLVRSELGLGSTFTLELPRSLTAEPAAMDAPTLTPRPSQAPRSVQT